MTSQNYLDRMHGMYLGKSLRAETQLSSRFIKKNPPPIAVLVQIFALSVPFVPSRGLDHEVRA